MVLAIGYYLDDSGWYAAILPAILCHELGHWIAICFLGGRVTSLRVDLSGICMETTAFSDRISEISVLAAGPVFGFLWGAAAERLNNPWGEKSQLISLALNSFNLLPALPLDGGRILYCLTRSTRLLRSSGLVTAAALVYIAIRSGHWGLIIPAVLLSVHAVRT